MEASKVQIGLLEGKSNWSTWKYKLCILLRGVKGGLEVLEGKLQAPKPLVENASQEEKSSYVKQADEDIATHTCKLKNLWNSLQKEISKDKTLPAEYFSFKSSWNLMSDTDKNIDNLTSQLCAYEKALTMKCETRQEVLQTTASRRNNLTCNYCKLKGHKVRDCVKWKTDGRPPKPEKQKKDNRVKTKTLLYWQSQALYCFARVIKTIEIVNENKNEYLPPLPQDNVLGYVKSRDSSKNEEVEDRSEEEILGDVENIHENPEMRNIERENTETEHDTAEYSDDIEEIDHDTIEEDNIELRS
ncbi:hypothetical protein JTB14_027360 [Gonioctena quinquepunctata]|nr:hypothetical protein JTB14_027360 [Gonioctena quinquepunctata]